MSEPHNNPNEQPEPAPANEANLDQAATDDQSEQAENRNVNFESRNQDRDRLAH